MSESPTRINRCRRFAMVGTGSTVHKNDVFISATTFKLDYSNLLHNKSNEKQEILGIVGLILPVRNMNIT